VVFIIINVTFSSLKQSLFHLLILNTVHRSLSKQKQHNYNLFDCISSKNPFKIGSCTWFYW